MRSFNYTRKNVCHHHYNSTYHHRRKRRQEALRRRQRSRPIVGSAAASRPWTSSYFRTRTRPRACTRNRPRFRRVRRAFGRTPPSKICPGPVGRTCRNDAKRYGSIRFCSPFHTQGIGRLVLKWRLIINFSSRRKYDVQCHDNSVFLL